MSNETWKYRTQQLSPLSAYKFARQYLNTPALVQTEMDLINHYLKVGPARYRRESRNGILKAGSGRIGAMMAAWLLRLRPIVTDPFPFYPSREDWAK